jgi:hypothetical protein
LNLVVGRLTVPIIESHCNQLKLGHPPKKRLAQSKLVKMVLNRGKAVA